MDSSYKGRYALFLCVLVFFFSLVLPFSSANATGSIGRQVASFCAPMATSPNVSSCQACHMTNNESVDDLNAAGMQARSNPGFFCPGGTPAPTPTPSPAPTPTPTPGMSGTGAMSGTGMRGRSGMRSRSGMSGSRGFRSRSGSRSGSRFSSHDDDDDEDDDDDDRERDDD